VNLGAVNLEIVDKLSERNVGVGLGVAKNHGEASSLLTCFLETGEEGGNENGMGVHHNLYFELGVPPGLSLFEILAAEATNVITNRLVLEGHEFVRLKIKFCCGIGNETHNFSLLNK
jgi:hypothetical protein